jgi:hypothetical protein
VNTVGALDCIRIERRRLLGRGLRLHPDHERSVRRLCLPRQH